MNKPLTKNQHYIPQLLLRNFANPKEKLFECLHKDSKIYPSSVESSMTSRYTYEHKEFEPNEIEIFFSRIESDIKPYIDSIANSIKNYNKDTDAITSIKETIFLNLNFYLVLYYRSGALLNEMGFDKNTKGNRIITMMNKLMDSRYINELSETIINYYDFALIRSSQENFLLSDQCVATIALGVKNNFTEGSNRHMGLKNTLILMPISSEYYIVFINGIGLDFIFKDKINVLSDVDTDSINKIIINNSYVKTVSLKEEPLLLALSDYNFQSPHAVITNKFRVNKKKELFYFKDDAKEWEMINNVPDLWKFSKTGRNEKCPCGSNKNYKKCCSNAYNRASKIVAEFARTQSFPFISYKDSKYAVSENATIEKPISEFFSDIEH